MNQARQNAAFRVVTEILFNRIGEEKAATIRELRAAAGIGRRAMEHLLELKFGDFPFPVISTTAGYFRPACAAEINHCLESLQSRNVCIYLRRRTIIRNAKAAGYERQGKRFVAPTHASRDLFEAQERRTA